VTDALAALSFVAIGFAGAKAIELIVDFAYRKGWLS